jgi:hypothetical protein
MRRNDAGKIARGAPAVECGDERMAEIREEVSGWARLNNRSFHLRDLFERLPETIRFRVAGVPLVAWCSPPVKLI